jgi:FtsP/CotA-like multicopper oxidase with cupredoxin domain
MYNGEFPGPTLRAGSGANVSMVLDNQLADESTIHWHGMIVPHSEDGHPADFVLPGGTRTYAYQINQRAAMNWYHPHPHGLTGQQVHLGLAGAFILEDNVEQSLGLPRGLPYEVPLIIRDAKLDSNGNMQYKASRNGYEGNLGLVNGTLDATLDVEPALYRFRMLNGSNARNYRLSLSDGSPLTVIGNDGGLLEMSEPCSEITFAPGERLDILIDFKRMQGAKIMLHDLDAGWDLLEFVVQNSGDAGGTIPSGLAPLPVPKLTPADAVRTRDFSFDGMNRINGRTYAVDRIDETVPQGDVELWRFTTNGNAPHPVHVHIEAFQIHSRTGGRGMVMPWEKGLKDTVLLEDGETVEVLVQFNQYKGVYLMHCHKLEHEDIGMMQNFEVV